MTVSILHLCITHFIRVINTLKFPGRFHIQRHKESTGRVVFWAMGIMCSYTMEASYGGTNMGSRAFTHFNTEDYEGVGRYFCETLLDHQV